jgi:hypothetical protein
MSRIVRLTESDLVKIIKNIISEQGALGMIGRAFAGDASLGPSLSDFEASNAEPLDIIEELFTKCRKYSDGQLNINSADAPTIAFDLQKQIKGVSIGSNTANIFKRIKDETQFCRVDRNYSRKKYGDLFKDLDGEWGLSWKTILDSMPWIMVNRRMS